MPGGRPGRQGCRAGPRDAPERVREARDRRGVDTGGRLAEQLDADARQRGRQRERGAQKEDGGRTAGEDRLDRVVAADERHHEVHRDHVGLEIEDELLGVRPVGRLADDLEIGHAFERRPEQLPEERRVVDEEHAEGHCCTAARLCSARQVASLHSAPGRVPPRSGSRLMA